MDPTIEAFLLAGAIVLFILCVCSSRVRRRLCDWTNAARAREGFGWRSGVPRVPSVLAELPRFDRLNESTSFYSVASDDSFVSCIGDDLYRAVSGPITKARVSLLSAGSAAAAAAAAKQGPPPKPKQRARNANRVSSYRWLASVLEAIVDGTCIGGVVDSETQEAGTPLFVVAGGCPNGMCGMQAVLYVWLQRGAVDFWWIKPEKNSATELERETMNKNAKGPHKNTAERSARLYQPLADKFLGQEEGDFRFKVDASGRACIVEVGTEDSPTRTELLLYMVWQEDWSGAMARQKYIEGKLCYKKVSVEPGGGDDADASSTPRGLKRTVSPGFFTRQYRIQNDRIWIAPGEDEEAVPSLLPPDSFQEMYVMDF